MDSRPHAVEPKARPRASANGSANSKDIRELSSTTQVSPPIPISSAPQPERRSYDGQRAILTGIYVVITIYLGMLLTVLPWKEAWTQNSLVEAFPALRAFLGNNFTRGVVSGLGLVDIWMGVSEAVSFRVLKKS